MKQGGLDPILRGMICTASQEVDTKAVDGVRNFLFGTNTKGFDLVAINIQRGRDHGKKKNKKQKKKNKRRRRRKRKRKNKTKKKRKQKKLYLFLTIKFLSSSSLSFLPFFHSFLIVVSFLLFYFLFSIVLIYKKVFLTTTVYVKGWV